MIITPASPEARLVMDHLTITGPLVLPENFHFEITDCVFWNPTPERNLARAWYLAVCWWRRRRVDEVRDAAFVVDA